ncbi:MAG: DUF445 family protein [Candidatus Sericytochromatia bacterium]
MLTFYAIIRPFFQPLIGAFHGWFATRMVVVMLFRPHKEYYFPITGKKIPFTPGIFPSRKKDLARNISRTVTESLLTPEDIKYRADKFITEENIGVIVGATFDTMIDNLNYTDNIKKLADSLSHNIPDLINNTTSGFLEKLTDDHNKQLTKLTEFLVHDVFLNLKISEGFAIKAIDYVFDSFISPHNIRVTLQEALTPERAANLQQVLRERTTGALKFILALVNLESIFNNFKDYLKNEPEKSEQLIKDIINQLKVKKDLVNKIVSIDFKQLSFDNIESIKKHLKEGISSYLLNNRESIDKGLHHVKDSISETIRNQIVNFSPSQLKPETIQTIKTEISRFIYNYLKKDLTGLINKGLEALKPKEMIESKIEAYSSQEVENLILGIMKKELKNLELLGLLIGLILGISALAIEYFLPIR